MFEQDEVYLVVSLNTSPLADDSVKIGDEYVAKSKFEAVSKTDKNSVATPSALCPKNVEGFSIAKKVVIGESMTFPEEALKENAAKEDVVNSPKHYAVLDELEAIHVIRNTMTEEQWYGYCLGNIIKYRLRAGSKDALQQDIDKANKYKALYEEML